jgi:hypothetical protein
MFILYISISVFGEKQNIVAAITSNIFSLQTVLRCLLSLLVKQSKVVPVL